MHAPASSSPTGATLLDRYGRLIISSLRDALPREALVRAVGTARRTILAEFGGTSPYFRRGAAEAAAARRSAVLKLAAAEVEPLQIGQRVGLSQRRVRQILRADIGKAARLGAAAQATQSRDRKAKL